MENDRGLVGNEQIEKDIKRLKDSFTDENLAVVLTTIRKRILDGGQFVVAVDASVDANNLALKTASFQGKKWFIAYTSFDEELKGDLSVMSGFLAEIDKLFDMASSSAEVEGILLNPYGNLLTINKQLIDAIRG